MDLARIDEINQIVSRVPMKPSRMTFGTQSSLQGRRRIARFMTSMQEKNVMTTMYKKGAAYRQHEGYAMRYMIKDELELGEETLTKEFKTVEDILVAEIAEGLEHPDANLFVYFRRHLHTKEPPDATESKEARVEEFRKILLGFLAGTDDIAVKPAREAVETIAQCYLDCEFLHPLSNGNYRLFGLLMVNVLLAKAGLPPTVIDNPNLSDGSSRDEVADMILAGQETLKQWSINAAGS